MTPLTRAGLMALASGLGSFGLVRAARAYPSGGTGGPWVWLALVVVALAFAVIWTVLAIVERRQTPPAKTPRQ